MSEEGAEAVLEWTWFDAWLLSGWVVNQVTGQEEQFEVYAADDGRWFHTLCWRGHFRFLRNRVALPTESDARAACECYNATGRWGVQSVAEEETEQWEEVWYTYPGNAGASAGFAEGRWYRVELAQDTEPTQDVADGDGGVLIKRWMAMTGPEPPEHDDAIEYGPRFDSLAAAKAACERHYASRLQGSREEKWEFVHLEPVPGGDGLALQ